MGCGWYWTGGKPLPEPMLTIFYDTIWHHYVRQEQLKCLHSENTSTRPMNTHAIDSYQIPFIPSQITLYNYKFLNITKPGTYVTLTTTFLPNLKAQALKMALRMRNRSKSLTRSLCAYSMRQGTNVTRGTPSPLGKMKWNACSQYCGSYGVDMDLSSDGQTDGQMDGQGKTNIPPTTMFCGV